MHRKVWHFFRLLRFSSFSTSQLCLNHSVHTSLKHTDIRQELRSGSAPWDLGQTISCNEIILTPVHTEQQKELAAYNRLTAAVKVFSLCSVCHNFDSASLRRQAHWNLLCTIYILSQALFHAWLTFRIIRCVTDWIHWFGEHSVVFRDDTASYSKSYEWTMSHVSTAWKKTS